MTVTTATKQRKPRGKGKPFVAGDPRINRKGRPHVPQSEIELRALIGELLDEAGTVRENGQDVRMKKINILLNKLILSKSPVGQIHILDRLFGKVTEKVEHSGEVAVKGYGTWNPDEWDKDKKQDDKG